MPRLLILFAHPALEKSRVQARLLKELKGLDGITFRDLYEKYPDFDIDIQREKDLLLQHDVVAWQHPFYWYSAPAIIKQWLDLVLEHGWAYGSGGNALEGKKAFNIISCGGPLEAYNPQGRNRFTIQQLLAPFDQTAHLCKMAYLPPFVVPGTHRLLPQQIDAYAVQYTKMLQVITSGTQPFENAGANVFMNNLIPDSFSIL